MYSIILAVLVLGIALALFSVRLFFIKDGEVRGGCASKNPLLSEEGATCGVCGKNPVVEGCGEKDGNV